jgi:hypothetical protein
VDNFGYVVTMNTRMRAGIAFGILLLVACRCGAAGSTPPGWQNSLSPKGTPAPSLTLVKDGRPAYVILLPPPPGGIRYPIDAPFLTKEFLDRATELMARATKRGRRR